MPLCPTCGDREPEPLGFCPRDGTALLPDLLDGSRFRLLSKLGSGGMGTVFLAEHTALGKRVAIKVLKAEFSRDPTLAKRFELEAIRAGRIGHPGIVEVNDLGRTSGGALYFVMELLEGQSLGALLQRERFLSLPRAVGLLTQVCSALEAAHLHGIIHRDLKPHNIMVAAERIKVLDFGISKSAGLVPAERLTERGDILGTPEYMAPEQALGEAVDARSDVYALGVVAYECITGTLPFRGDSTVTTLLAQVNDLPEAPSRRRPDLALPLAVDRVLLRAMEKVPARRQASMAQLRAELQTLVTGAGAELSATPAMRGTLVHMKALRRTGWQRASILGGVLAGMTVVVTLAWPAHRKEDAPAAPVSSGAPTSSGDAGRDATHVAAGGSKLAPVLPPRQSEGRPARRSKMEKVGDIKPNPF